MPKTYEPIATQTLGSAAASVTFSSITGSYTDLVLIINGSVTSGNPSVWMRFNSDSGSNYSFTRLTGNGTSALSSREVSQTKGNIASAFGMTTTYETNLVVQIMNYSNTTTNKTTLARANTPSLGTESSVNLYRSTSAITAIEILNSSATNFSTGSTFSLYGIKAA
jgi:hypothetical protein